MRKLVLQKECGVVSKMIADRLIPNDIVYPVCLVYNTTTEPHTLDIGDADKRKWSFEI